MKADKIRALSFVDKHETLVLSGNNSLFEIAARLNKDAEKQLNEGNFERAFKSKMIAKEIQKLASEKLQTALK
ncbi:MAG: hypothetical protein IPP32_15000 [Bacteroidetes bacterium]|nr:hypothetical protein [Bacteroidota bacterium]